MYAPEPAAPESAPPELPASEPAPPERFMAERAPDESPNPFDDEDDATAIMGKPPIEDIRRVLEMGLSQEREVAAPLAPAARGLPATPYDVTPPPRHFGAQPFESPAAPYGSQQAPFDSQQTPFGSQQMPFNPDQAAWADQAAGQARAEFPPPPGPPIPAGAEAYPPSIPAPAPTGIAQPDIDESEIRRASRGPILVLLGLVVMVVLLMALLLFLNYRGIIT